MNNQNANVNEWFIADTHFDHRNILEFEDRPFETIEEMKEKMIEAWNGVVGKNDIIYLIGDFCFGDYKKWIGILDSLKGRVVLVKGNHDKSKVVQKVINQGYLHEYHPVGTLLREDKYSLHLTHYPMLIGETRVFNFNISGHIHNQPSPAINIINVGVDSDFMKHYYTLANAPFGTPVSKAFLMGHVEMINDVLTENKIKQLEERSNGN